MESQSSRPEQQLNEYNDVSTVRAHMCGMPLKNFYTVCAEIRGTCHVGEKQKKLIAFREAIKKRQTTATPAMAPDAPVAAGLTPHLRCAGVILTLRDGERFHSLGFTTSRMRTWCRPGKTPHPLSVIQPRDSTTSWTRVVTWSTSLAGCWDTPYSL